MSWPGERCPARRHTTARDWARTWLIAASTRSASAARASITRDTVGSDATCPNTSGFVRSTAMSARQSPPTAVATARSSSTLPGSCTASGRRHRANAADSARSSRSVRIVSIRTTAPACDTNRDPVVSTRNRGYQPVDLPTRRVPSPEREQRLQQSLFSLVRAPFVMINTAFNAIPRESAGLDRREPWTTTVTVLVARDEHGPDCDGEGCDGAHVLADNTTAYLELTIDDALDLRHAIDRGMRVARGGVPRTE